jgi:peroxiredoxin
MTLLIVLGLVVPWIIVALGFWLGYRLVVQNGVILAKLEGLEAVSEDLGAPGRKANVTAPRGLDAGVTAPAFELPELHGGLVSLEQFRGRRVLLVFFSSNCVYCEMMAPELGRLPLDGRDRRPVPLVITGAKAGEMRPFVAKHGIRCSVLLQEGGEVSKVYKGTSTPSGYLIDEEGTLISDLVVGAEPLMDLATNPASALIKTGQNVAFLGMPKRLESEA